MATGKILVVPPKKGFAQVNAFSEQPELTSPDLRNVMILEVATERFRVGIRPGIGWYDGFDYAAQAALVTGTEATTVRGAITVAGTDTLTLAAAGGKAQFEYAVNIAGSWTIQPHPAWITVQVAISSNLGAYQLFDLAGLDGSTIHGHAVLFVGSIVNASGSARSSTLTLGWPTGSTYAITCNQAHT